VEGDGAHELSYQAFDAAGNASDVKTTSFKIDGTAPTGAFALPDASDPRQIEVVVADATSGVSSGRIEYRRQGQGSFTKLATTLKDGHLRARLDDLALTRHRYELRAVVADVAGNQGVITRRIDGAAMALSLPLRTSALVHVSATQRVLTCSQPKQPARKPAKRRRATAKRCVLNLVDRVAPGTLALPYGQVTPSAGRLMRADGAPIGNAVLTVEGQLRSGGAFTRLGTATTDANGAFAFSIPAGPSRTLRYSYAGSNTVRPSAAQLSTQVTASTSLRASRKRLRNRQAVVFTGTLAGRPIPATGKLVALQAKVGRRWRTFATPTANAVNGRFRYRYRFTSTTGLRRYAFRALVTREAAYPYEQGASKVVTVVVRGRRTR
jgi:hypothetical protein